MALLTRHESFQLESAEIPGCRRGWDVVDYDHGIRVCIHPTRPASIWISVYPDRCVPAGVQLSNLVTHLKLFSRGDGPPSQ